MNHFELVSEYKPTGDQPQAIKKLSDGFLEGNQFMKREAWPRMSLHGIKIPVFSAISALSFVLTLRFARFS